MRITMLGTGHAVVTECYNSCFVLQDDAGDGLLVDGGGGSGIVTQMKRAGIPWSSIRQIVVTHKHIDHLLGVVWALRMLCMEMRRGGAGDGSSERYGNLLGGGDAPACDVTVLANGEVMGLLKTMAYELLHGADLQTLSERFRFEVAHAGETRELLGCPTTFFGMPACRDAEQLGFAMTYEPGHTLVCCGDVSLVERDFPRAQGATWLLHEAFCLADHPAADYIHHAGHSTAAEAAAIAQAVGAQNLLLYHTEDGDLAHRRERYTAEASTQFSGSIYVPDDLDSIQL